MVYTTPWDSYLIHAKIWSYPPDAILGPTLLRIPLEELFFFIIQTYTTSLLYLLLNTPTLFVAHLLDDSGEPNQYIKHIRFRKRLGQIFFTCHIVVPYFAEKTMLGDSTYIRLILLWAGPVLLLLWSLAYQPLLTLPRSKTWLPIAIPTLYLWLVDTIALRRGTWSIETGTKLGINLWPGLEIEEAVFFLITNTLVVFGLVAFDNSLAVLDAFPALFPAVPALPSPVVLVKALLIPTTSYDCARLSGLRSALSVLRQKSRSFYLASGVFSGRLRIDLILLYAFCRVADDLVDNASDVGDARHWISLLEHFLHAAYASPQTNQRLEAAIAPFPPNARSILRLLPVDKLPSAPLYSLLEGFRTDLKFASSIPNDPHTSAVAKTNAKDQPDKNCSACPTKSPIQSQADIELYASRVASTVAELCIHLVYHHSPDPQHVNVETQEQCLIAGARMGVALQYVNISRDVGQDAEAGRCYLPSEWLSSSSTAQDFQHAVLVSRKRVLDMALDIYEENRAAIEDLPEYAKDGIRVAVESYIEIGRVVREKMIRKEPLDFCGGGTAGRASVPRVRRLWVGWKAMAGFGVRKSRATTLVSKDKI